MAAKAEPGQPETQAQGQADHKPTIYCINWGHGLATQFCKDCEQFYCQNCVESHQNIKKVCNHSMTLVDEMPKKQIEKAIKTCTKHEKPFNTLCTSCKVLICQDCGQAHKEHLLMKLKDAAKEAQRNLEDIKRDINECKDQQETLLKRTHDTEAQIRKSVEDTKTKISQAAKQNRDATDKFEKQLLDDVELYSQEALSNLRSIEAKCRSDQEAVSTLLTQSLKQPDTDISLVAGMPAIQRMGQDLALTPSQDLAWELDFKAIPHVQTLVKYFGKTNIGYINLISPLVKNHKGLSMGQPVKKVPLTSNSGMVVSGMVVVEDRLCVTCTDKTKLWLYNRHNGQPEDSNVNALGNPQGMMLCDSGAVVADDSGNGALHYLKFGETVEKQYKKQFEQPCRFLGSETESENLFPLDQNKSRKQYLHCVTKTQNGYSALMQSTSTTSKKTLIRCLDTDRTYSLYNALDFVHMIADRDGRLIVVDQANHRLHLVGASGNLLQYLLTEDDGIHKPMCIFLDHTSDLLYVAHAPPEGLQVRVYKYPPGMTICHLENCKLCEDVIESQYFTGYNGEKHDVIGKINCKTENVVYGVHCTKCAHVIYVGSTSGSLETRGSQHKNDIIKDKKQKSVAKHFLTDDGHNITHFKVIGLVQENGDEQLRVDMENKWMDALGTLEFGENRRRACKGKPSKKGLQQQGTSN